jgi:hypothetical protein
MGETRIEEMRIGEDQRDFSLRSLILNYSAYQGYRF